MRRSRRPQEPRAPSPATFPLSGPARAHHTPAGEASTALQPEPSAAIARLLSLKAIPEEHLWLASQRSPARMADVILKRYVAELGIRGRYSAHSMRATFITRALENGAPLEEVQRAAGHADASTTKLYDRRGYNPERSAALYATY